MFWLTKKMIKEKKKKYRKIKPCILLPNISNVCFVFSRYVTSGYELNTTIR